MAGGNRRGREGPMQRTWQPLMVPRLRLPCCPQAISYVSRRRMDDADFNPDAVDADGLPLVYNEVRLERGVFSC